MSKLEELIAEFCPEGVEYKSFGELATILRGASPRPIKNFIISDDEEDGVNWIKIGDVAVGSKYVTHAKERITAKGAEKSRKVKKGDFILSNSMSFGRPYILSIDGCIHDGWLAISDFNASFVPDFLYYLLSSQVVQQEMVKRASSGGAVQNLNADIVKSLMLPVPPLPVQSEIVRILDNFTELTAELTEQLTAELTARKKQYEYYRDELLNTKYDKVLFGDVATIVRGASPRPIKDFVTDSDDGVNWIKIGDVKPNTKYITTTKEKITKEGAKKSRFVKQGDFILSNSMSFGRPYIIKNEGCIHDGWLSISGFSELYIPDFLYHLLNSNMLQNAMKQKASNGGAVSNLNADIVKSLELPLVPIKEQQRIVDILDHFDALCNDIFTCLTAEIEARKKQYEYYRDKLMTFKQLS